MRLPIVRIGRGMHGAGLVPTLARDGAWRLTMAGVLVYGVWQVLVAVAAVLAWRERVMGGPCRVGPLCAALADWSDPRVSWTALLTLVASAVVLLVLMRVGLGLWRGRFWAGWAARALGWATAVGGVLLILLGGIVWLVLGVWIAYWARRLRYDPPAWAEGRGTMYDGAPADGAVIEGERVP